MRVWIPATLAGFHINITENGPSTATLELDLFRDIDRMAAAQVFDRGRFSAHEHHIDLQVLQWWTEEFVRAITSSLSKMPYGMRYMARETLNAVKVHSV